MKLFFASKAANLEEYRRTVKRRAIVFWLITMLGAATLTVTVFLMNGRIADAPETAHLQGVWCGVGTGLCLAGAVFALRARHLLDREEALRAAMREEQDERNQAISQKALSVAAVVEFLLLYVLMFVFTFFDMTVVHILLFCALAFVFCFLVARHICMRVM